MTTNDLPDWLQPDPDDYLTSQDLSGHAADYFDGSAELPAIREPETSEWGNYDDMDDLPDDWENEDGLPFLTIIDQETGEILETIQDSEALPAPPSEDVMNRAREIAQAKAKAADPSTAEAEELKTAIRKRGIDQKKAFMEDARDLWRMDALNLWKKAGYTSRQEFLASPENHQETTRGNLAIHIYEILCGYFNMDFQHTAIRHHKPITIDLCLVGFRAYMILEHTLSSIQAESITAGGVQNLLEWNRYRAQVEDWLLEAFSLSTRDLEAKVYEGNKWITYFTGILTPGTLRYVYDAEGTIIRARTVDEVIDLLGMSDLPDDRQLSGSIRGKEESDEQAP